MLTVQLSISIWWMMLALIPLAVLILAVSAVLPARGRLHNLYESTVASILFYPLPGAPSVTFIKFILASLSLVSLLVGFQVYSDSQKDALPHNMPLDKQLLAQAKGWRNQRNLYLTCLALALWWMVFTTFTYKAKIARLLHQVDESAAAAPQHKQSSNSAHGSSSSSNKKKAAPALVDEVHDQAAPINTQEGVPVQRKLPKPTAPKDE